MTETQATICDWALQTFGASGSDLRVASRANEEMAETIRALAAGRSAGAVAMELADTMIVLCRLGNRLGLKLSIPATEAPDGFALSQHVVQANRFMAMLMLAIVIGDRHSAKDELAKLWTALRWAITACGTTPQEAIDAKMVVNRNRVWKVTDGHGYHVREKSNG